MQRLHALITGRVQGVGFRYEVQRAALRAGLTGLVRNLGTHQVEVIAEGETAALQALLKRLREGPPAARVDNVQTSLGPATGEFRSFKVWPSS